MSDVIRQGPPDEQSICVTCGFCCDGTLFRNAGLHPGERGHLPEKIEEASFSEGGKNYFRLPCKYFSGKCTIYNLRRADVCSDFRCLLLNNFAEEKVTGHDALETIREARVMLKEIMEEYRRISGNSEKISFRQLLIELGRTQKSASEEKPLGTDYELLLARCNIFEALLTKHFRSASDFEKLVMR